MSLRLFSVFGLISLLSLPMVSGRTWINSSGQPIKGSFIDLSSGVVKIRLDDTNKVVSVPLKVLSKADQEFVGKRAMTGKADLVALAVKRIDAAIDAGLEKKNLKYNEGLNDHMYLRRVYLDIAGRIPDYDEAKDFLNSRKKNKRQELVIKLLKSWDYASHNYNHLAELLRIQTTFPGTILRNDAFIHWLKEQIDTNTPWDELVREIVMAEGRIWDNPAVGYHLRDNGMKLDHVAFMGKVFLGTNITCAQCHDDPDGEWTQYQYYEFSAYLADLETKGKAQQAKMPKKKELEAYIANSQKLDPGNEEQKRRINNIVGNYQRAIRDMSRASELRVHTVANRSMRLPDNYQYEDGFPRDKVDPWILFGKENGSTAAALNPRQRLAAWLTSRKNERFAMNIANRMWARYMGRGAAEPIHNIDPEKSLNADLLKVLAEEMVSLNFDLKAFAWAIVNTKAYNRLASRKEVNITDPYYFPGPLLRRMTSEQVWDSLITLMVEDPNQFKLDSGKRYNQLINSSQSAGTPKDFVARVDEFNKFKPEQSLVNAAGVSILKAKPPKGEKPFGQTALSKKPTGPTDEEMMMAFMEAARKRKLLLARASELPQPSDPAHFLSKFGQSDRTFVINASSLKGSVPQVMELMNGYATEILTQPGSRIFLEMKNLRSNFEKADVAFISILSRRAVGSEQHLLDRELRSGGPEVFSDLIWALLNTPEFLFIK